MNHDDNSRQDEKTVSDIAQEILEEDAQAIEEESVQKTDDSSQTEKTDQASEEDRSFHQDSSEVTEKVEPAKAQTGKQPPVIPSDPENSIPPQAPKSKPASPKNVRKTSTIAAFIFAGLFYLAALISGISTAVASTQITYQQPQMEENDYDFFDRFDFDDSFGGYDEDEGFTFDFQSSASQDPIRRVSQDSRTRFNVQMPAGSDYTPAFGFAICGTLFACTGLLLLNKKD